MSQPLPPLRGKSWALEGLRSLKIDLAPRDAPLRFQSLGSDPTLQIGLVDGRRIDLLAWSAALLVLLGGLLLLRNSASTQTRFVLGVLVVATVVPLFLGGYRPWGATFDFAIYAALLLIPVYLVAALWRRLVAVVQPMFVPQATAMLLAVCLTAVADAQPPAEPIRMPPAGPLSVQIVEPDPPAKVPSDAILVPYDPSSPEDATKAERILVPYERYVELWNQANPDQRLTRDAPPAPYAFAGGQWRTTLVDDEYLLIEGELEFDQYVERPVAVPLNFGGGVLQRAELDGRPARIQLIQAADPPQASAAQTRTVQSMEVQELATLHMNGEGRKQLALAVRYRLQRNGGWRTVRGRLPGATINALALTIPDPRTEVRLSGVVDRTSFETTEPQERIDTALTPDGAFQIEWRPKVGQATVDRSLTVESEVVLDVQEDGLRLAWAMQLKFPLSQRDRFTVQLPDAYVVEQVEGDNVRGWKAEEGRLEITLLKTARDAQSLVLHLSRRSPLAQKT